MRPTFVVVFLLNSAKINLETCISQIYSLTKIVNQFMLLYTSILGHSQSTFNWGIRLRRFDRRFFFITIYKFNIDTRFKFFFLFFKWFNFIFQIFDCEILVRTVKNKSVDGYTLSHNKPTLIVSYFTNNAWMRVLVV